MTYGQPEAPEATWADAAVSEGVRAALPNLLALVHLHVHTGAPQVRLPHNLPKTAALRFTC